MRLHFSLEYITAWGESLWVSISLHYLQGQSETQLVPLETSDGRVWTGGLALPVRGLTGFGYRYEVHCNDQVTRREWAKAERCYAAAELDFHFEDCWRDVPAMPHLFTTAYMHAACPNKLSHAAMPYFRQTLLLRTEAPQLERGQALAVLGNMPTLGNWHVHHAVRMQMVGVNQWVLHLSASGMRFPFEYKYVVIDEKSGEVLAWEEGDNRCCMCAVGDQQLCAIHDCAPRLPLRVWRAAGVVVPVFSLRSGRSQGVGDFSDLLNMARWAKEAGMKVVQILPVNDTTLTRTNADSYPYSSISVYALHPIYIDLSQLPRIADKGFMAQHEKQCAKLNALPKLDYQSVLAMKEEYLRRLYAQCRQELAHDSGYQSFCRDNAAWLKPYAAFCHLRDKYGTARFNTWPAHSCYDAVAIDALFVQEAGAMEYYMYVQYLLDAQLWAVADAAREMGVVLKGDIPIGVSPCSVEVWTEPKLFHTDCQTGAPPDDFSAAGQNWGFPTYNWQAMQADGCRWWKSRFCRMARYFDAYRIDHVLGFFRIWEIPAQSGDALQGHFSPALPMSVEEIRGFGFPFDADQIDSPRVVDALPCIPTSAKPSLEGLFLPDTARPNLYHPCIAGKKSAAYSRLPLKARQAYDALHEHFFYHRHNDFWRAEAMQKLPALVEATDMLPCAEDLGMVPACVPSVLHELGILSLEIESMPKAFAQFGSVAHNPYASVCTLFTHDMPTLRQWWEEDAERRQSYYNHVLHQSGDAPALLSPELARVVVDNQAASSSMLCLLSLQDWLATDGALRNAEAQDERINIPANANHYWCYRMHLTLEQLAQADDFATQIRQLLAANHR